MTIAITGASGHLGRLTVESLIARGVAPETILATARHPESLARFGERGVRTRLLDYDRPETIPAALQGVDTLLLISSRGAQDRVQQHQSVIDSARSAGIGRVVYTSTIPGMVLSPDHVATEQVLKQSGLATTILRNGWYTDNYLLVSKGGSELYIAAAGNPDFSKALKVTDYHKPNIVYRGYGGGYGGGF